MGKNVQHIQVKTTGAKKSQKAIKGVPPNDFPALIKLGDIVFITL